MEVFSKKREELWTPQASYQSLEVSNNTASSFAYNRPCRLLRVKRWTTLNADLTFNTYLVLLFGDLINLCTMVSYHF